MNAVEKLKTFGYAIVENVVAPDVCRELGDAFDRIEERKRKAGRLYDLKSQIALFNLHVEDPDRMIGWLDFEPVYSVAEQLLNNGQQIVLNSLSASRSVKVDQINENDDIWRAHIDHRMPTPDLPHTASFVAMTCIDDFRIDTGASRIWPLSHRSGMRPPPDVATADLPGSLTCTAPRGSVIFWLGQTWHAIGRNTSGARRWGLLHHYTYWWVKPSFDYTQCGPDIYRRLTQRQKGLLGFNSRPPVSPDVRIYTVTDIAKLPSNYDEAMRIDFAMGQRPHGDHTTADSN